MKIKLTDEGFLIQNLRKIIRIMRISLFLIFISSAMAFSAVSYSQSARLTLALDNVTVKEAIKAIEEQSEFIFFYQDQLIDLNRKVSLHVSNEDIEAILSKLFNDTMNIYAISERQIIVGKLQMPEDIKSIPIEKIINISQPERKIITGNVVDEKGLPLPGVNILLKGTITGTITDLQGNFSLDVTDGNMLVFSFVGFASQEVEIGDKVIFNIQLFEDITDFEELVVVGYGVQKKVNLTGSVAAIKIDEKMTSRTMSNVSYGLSGLLPGLAVSQNTGMAGKNDVTLLIRGLGTVNNADPLIVVDGMPDVDINRLNMNDIESISVLKDATSSAIYGSRAANGVILITTKTGKGEKTRLNISSSYSLVNPVQKYSFMPDYARALTVGQRADAVSKLRSNFTFKDGTIDQWMALGMIDPLRYPNTDWWDVFIRNGQVINHNISASGSNEKSNFFISLGIMDEKGLQINNDFSRYNVRFNYDYKVLKNMNLGVRFGGNWSKWLYADGLTAHDLQFAPAGVTPYDPVTGYFGGQMAYNESPTVFNGYAIYTNALRHQNRQEINPHMYLDWTPLAGLTAHVDYTLQYYNEFGWSAPIPTQGYNFQTETFTNRIYVSPNAGVSNSTYTGYKTQMNGRLNYNKVIAGNHEINLLAVYSEEYWYDRNQYSSRSNRLHPSLTELDAALPDIQTATGNSSTEGLQSYIGRLNYSAYNKYLLEANFRYDGSSKFLYGNQYGLFPSVAVGWRFTEENFLKPFTEKILTGGKFRFSYGGLGNNSGVGRYQQQETMVITNYMIDGQVVKGFSYQKMINRNLSWESTYITNIGLDLAFLDNRLTAEIDYYNRLTTGMNRPSELSLHLTGAYEAPRRNIGDLRNKGMELNLTWRDNVGELSYSINLNGSRNKNRLEKWNEFLGKGNVFIDMPYQFVYAYEDIGIAQTWQDIYNATPQGAEPGDILRVDLNGDGKIDENDMKAFPQYDQNRPTSNFGLLTSFAWKGIDLTILFQGAAGRRDFWLSQYNKTELGVIRESVSEMTWSNPWSTENRDGPWPRLNGNNNRNNQVFWLDDMSYLRLKNLQLGYTLPDKYLTRIGVKNTRIFGTGENLLTLTNFRGLDPEKQGSPNDGYPLLKTFSFGINIEF